MPLILADEYNSIQSQVSSVLGLTTSGWGSVALNSHPVTRNTKITAYQWNSLINDINIISSHIQNISTSTAFVITGTTTVTSSTSVELLGGVTVLSAEPTRYTCHPQQFILDETETTPLLRGTTSTRTTSWGLSPIVIRHIANVNFISRLHAYYYFNLGNYLVWRPYFLPADVAINDLDQEWISWINSINNNPNEEFRFNRDDFLAGGRTRTYSSGTLRMEVVAVREFDEKNINFTITYSNESTTLLVVSPTAAGYTINI
jgi:hypothetical protein